MEEHLIVEDTDDNVEVI